MRSIFTFAKVADLFITKARLRLLLAVSRRRSSAPAYLHESLTLFL